MNPKKPQDLSYKSRVPELSASQKEKLRISRGLRHVEKNSKQLMQEQIAMEIKHYEKEQLEEMYANEPIGDRVRAGL